MRHRESLSQIGFSIHSANPQDLKVEKADMRKSPSNEVSAPALLARQKRYEIGEDGMEYLTKK